jgi:beta-glucosidase
MRRSRSWQVLDGGRRCPCPGRTSRGELLGGLVQWIHTELDSVKVTDGPNGARGGSFYHMSKLDFRIYRLVLINLAPASALPNATCIGATFSKPLTEEAGKLLAEETKARNAVCLLAPTINIQRSPLGGRAFESFSEDPTHSGQIAAAYINGLQGEGISATIKHFVGNDQEHQRMGEVRRVHNSKPTELIELIITGLNHFSASASRGLSPTIPNCPKAQHPMGIHDLVQQGQRHPRFRAQAAPAGYPEEGMAARRTGYERLVRNILCFRVCQRWTRSRDARNVLRWAQKLAKLHPDVVYGAPSEEKTRYDDKEADAKVIRKVGAEGIVVLKNENSVLPVTEKKVAVIGPNAKARVLTGGGSAQLRAAWSYTPWQGLEDNKPSGVELEYSLGCAGAKFLPQLDENFTTVDGKKGFNLYHYKLEDGKQASKSGYDEVWDQSDMFMADFFPPGFGNDWFTELKSVFTSPIDGEYEFGLTITGQGWLWVDDKLIIDNSKDQQRGEAYFGNGTEEVKGTVKVQKGKVRVHESLSPPAC